MKKKYFLLIVLPAFFIFLFSLWKLLQADGNDKSGSNEKERIEDIRTNKNDFNTKKPDTTKINKGKYVGESPSRFLKTLKDF